MSVEHIIRATYHITHYKKVTIFDSVAYSDPHIVVADNDLHRRLKQLISDGRYIMSIDISTRRITR